MNVTLTHQAGYHSKIENDRGHQVSIDNKSGESPKGASPMELLLMGVAGCSSIDIIAVKSETYFKPEPKGNAYAVDLVQQISDMNNGTYLDENILNTAKTDFCIGVAGYPEKHMEAPNMESDIHFLKKKIEAGADYVVTQMFFDNSKYFAFVENCRAAGITVPIIPGLKPLATSKQINMIPHRFHVDFPEALIKEVLKAKTKEDVSQVGIDWCINQSKELVAANIPFLHYYSMGKSDNIHKLASTVF